MMRWIVPAAALAVLVFTAVLPGCAHARRKSEPLQGPMLNPTSSVERGKVLFDQHCHMCHPHGEPGLGPGINDKPVPRFLIHTQVRLGFGAMPAFKDSEINDKDLNDLLDYVMAVKRHKRSK